MEEAAPRPTGRRSRRSTPAPIARERNRPLRVVVSADERQKIEAAAADARMSVSAYLRALGLGHTPKSAFDKQAVQALVKAAGDQARLGGLLKLWLATKPGEGASEVDVARVLDECGVLSAEIRDRVLSL